MSDFLHFREPAHIGQDHGELVAPDAREQIAAPDLLLHARGEFPQVEIANLMAVEVVDLFEVIEIDVDKTEDAGDLAGLLDELVEEGFEREAVGDVGEQVEFGTVNEIRIEAAGFDGEGGEFGRDGERL